MSREPYCRTCNETDTQASSIFCVRFDIDTNMDCHRLTKRAIDIKRYIEREFIADIVGIGV